MIAEEVKPHAIEFYALALFKLSPRTIDNYVRARVQKSTNSVVVETNLPHEALANAAHTTAIIDGNFGYILKPLSRFIPDLELISKGQYSKLSVEAKDRIKKFSGLSYKIKSYNKDTVITDKLLLALDKEPILKKYWEDRIGMELPETAELADGPTESNFI